MLIDLEPLLGILSKNIVQTSENKLGAKIHIMGLFNQAPPLLPKKGENWMSDYKLMDRLSYHFFMRWNHKQPLRLYLAKLYDNV